MTICYMIIIVSKTVTKTNTDDIKFGFDLKSPVMKDLEKMLPYRTILHNQPLCFNYSKNGILYYVMTYV